MVAPAGEVMGTISQANRTAPYVFAYHDDYSAALPLSTLMPLRARLDD